MKGQLNILGLRDTYGSTNYIYLILFDIENSIVIPYKNIVRQYSHIFEQRTVKLEIAIN